MENKFPVITGRTGQNGLKCLSRLSRPTRGFPGMGFVWTDYYCERESPKQLFHNSGKPQNPKPFPIFA